ncbi:MAG: hypothetical protein R2877_01320 [Bdellovibrionota bacterium]
MTRWGQILILLALGLAWNAYAQDQDLESCDPLLVEKLMIIQNSDAKLDFDGIYLLVKGQGKNVNCTFQVEDQIVSPLLFAVSHMEVRLVDLLLSQGADPNFVQPERNVTPLARAAWKSANKPHDQPDWKDNFLIANYLIQHGRL